METPDDRSLTDLLDRSGVERRSYLQLLGSTALAGGLAGVARGAGEIAPEDCLSVPAAIAGDDGTVGDAELLEAIEHWRANTEVPGTCGETVDDATLLELIELWRSGERVDPPGSSFDESLYVDAETGADDNPGTEAEPFGSIQKAMDRATELKESGRSVHVHIAEGTYREAVQFADSDSGDTHPRVLVEGAGPEKTVIKGSEVFDGWQREEGDVFSHDWTENWGVASDPTNGDYITDCENHPNFCADTPELVLRREMVFVDGERMRQVLSEDEMEPGTYFVDEGDGDDGTIYLHPPADVTLADSTVEVALREKGWFMQDENNVRIRNIGVEQVATPWTLGLAAMVLDGDDVTAENVRVVDNNFDGLAPRGDDITLRDFALNRNGGSGFGPYKVRNFLAEDGEVNANNWRGALGGYTGWTVGNKFFKGRNVTVRRTSFNDNLSRGLWLDTDLEDVLLEDVEVRGNLRDNIWVERTQGPITLRRVVSTESDGYGLLVSNAMNTNVEDCRLVDNRKGGIHVSGNEGGVKIRDWDTDGEKILLKTRHLSVHDSVIGGVNGTVRGGTRGNYLIGTTFDDNWLDFVGTYEADDNTWYESDREDAFEWAPNELIDFQEWQDRTGEDQNSVWRSSADADGSGR